MNKQEIINKIENYVNELCGEIMEIEGVMSGDIDPSDAIQLEINYEEIANIILKVVEENK